MLNPMIKNSIYSALRNILGIIFPLITFSYAARILHADGLGQIEFTKSITGYFVTIALLGTASYGVREGARVRDDRLKLSYLTREILVIKGFAVTLSLIIFIFVTFKVDGLSDYRMLLLIFGMMIPLTALGLDWLYGAVEDYRYITIRTLLFQIISLCLMFIFVNDAGDIYKYALVQVLAAGGSGILNFIHARKYVSLRLGPLDLGSIRKRIAPIAFLFLLPVATQIYLLTGTTLLGFMASDRHVGLLAAANKICNVMVMMIYAVVLVLAPRFSYYAEKGMKDEIRKTTVKVVNYIFILCLPIALGFIMLSRPILLVFSGTDFLDADMTAKIMAFRVIFSPFNGFIAATLFISLRRDKWSIIATGSAAVANFIINMALIPRFQESGAAAATVLAEVIVFSVSIFFLAKVMKIRALFCDVWRYTGAALCMVPCYLVIRALVENVYVMTILTILFSVFAYFSVLRLMKNQYLIEMLNIVKSAVRKRG